MSEVRLAGLGAQHVPATSHEVPKGEARVTHATRASLFLKLP